MLTKILLAILVFVSIILMVDIKKRRNGEKGVAQLLLDYTAAQLQVSAHYQDPKLMRLMNVFYAQKFSLVEQILSDFSEDYLSFGVEMLAQIRNKKIIEKWMSNSNSVISRIVMGLHLIDKAWQERGDGFIDTVSASSGMRFHMLLCQAENILTNIKEQDTVFEVERLVALLTVYKALHNDRNIIHETFNKGLSISAHHIGLHQAYFNAISPKWGGSYEEVDTYLNTMPTKPELLVNIIKAMYYGDLLGVELVDDEETIQSIKNFVVSIALQNQNKSDLHRVTLYGYMLDIARIESFDLEKKFETLFDSCFNQLNW